MGAGKTTVGRLLAPLLGWRFVDTDEQLVARFGVPIAALFRDGERLFREREAAAIAASLHEDLVIVALGGGALEHPETRARLAGDAGALVVYLQVPLAVAVARCMAEPDAAVRPVLQEGDALAARFASRLPWYQAAELTIATEEQPPQAIAATIASLVRVRATPPVLDEPNKRAP